MSESTVTLQTSHTADEQRIREDLAACYRLISHHNMDDVIYTHVSARLDENRFLLNPFGFTFDEVTASNLVTVDMDGNLLDDPMGTGFIKAGFTIHSAVLSGRPDVMCVAHTHTVANVAVSCQRDGLLPINQWAMQFHNKVAYHEYEAIANDLEERDRLIEHLGDKPVMILRNHGILTAGRTIGEAWSYLYNFERSAQAQLALQAAGAPLEQPAPDIVDKTAGQYQEFYDRVHGREDYSSESDHEWSAMRRLMDREHPDYRS